MIVRRIGWMVSTLALSLAPAALADDAAKKMPSASVSQVVTVKATVTGLDLPARVITLKGPKGNSFTFRVSDDVKNLAQVKVGDIVVAKYYESYAIKVTKPGAPAAEAVEAAAAAQPGERPAGAVLKQESIKAKITAIGKHKESVTLKGPEGNSMTIKVKNPKNLEGVKVGDDVEITYTEALAVAVEPAPAKKK
jgi:Cu/Ag efflux protein CusF